MPDREKVIRGLECRLDINGSKYKHCLTCDYRHDIDHCQWACQTDGILEDALALLKAQEPRVMTWGEVRATLKAPVWKETKSRHNALYQGWVLAYDIQTGQGITGTRLGMAEPSGRVVWYKAEDYGKTWRCWTQRPSDEQREATQWE